MPIIALLALTVGFDVEVIPESPGGEPLLAVVTRDGDTSASLEVSLSTSHKSHLWAPSSVTIPAGETSVSVILETVNNSLLTGTTVTTLTATASGQADGVARVEVIDDDSPDVKSLGGRISGVLPAADYQVLADITVDKEVGLDIAAGSLLRFTAGTALNVNGRLTADGTSTARISFTREQDGGDSTWMGINIEDAEVSLRYVDIGYAANGVHVDGGSSAVEIADSRIHNSSNAGILVTAVASGVSAEEVQLLRNEIHNNKTGIAISSTSILCTSAGNSTLVHGNDVHANETGISLGAGFINGCIPASFSSVHSTVSQNYIHENRTGIATDASRFNGALGISEPTIVNNLITLNLADGMQLLGNGEPQVVNNTVVGNGGAAVRQRGTAFPIRNNVLANNAWGIVAEAAVEVDANTVTHNLVFENDGGDFVGFPEWLGQLTAFNRNETPADISMNINADPEFVGGSDYHLQTTSPAIDAGTDANAPVNDIDNDQRASSNHFSLGIADKGFYPLDIGFDELVPARDRR